MMLIAAPVPGTDAGPWLKGTAAQHEVWKHIFGSQVPAYSARKGVTTDANGVFFVKATPTSGDRLISIENDPTLGRRRLPTVSRVVESEFVYPLLRGKGVSAFSAVPDPVFSLVMPQRGKYGVDDLPVVGKRLHQWLRNFEVVLKERSSFKRFQARAGAAWWSLWSTGPYTFSPFKVAWREMSGGRFAAAYVGSVDHPVLGRKLVIPDHKLYFVPCDTEEEAAYLTGFLNAPVISGAVSAYASQLSLGASVVEYLLVPKYDAANDTCRQLAKLAIDITAAGGATTEDLAELDELAARIVGIPEEVLLSIRREFDDPLIMEAEEVVS